MVFGTERRVVVTHSDGLHDKQSAGFDQTLAKAGRQLSSYRPASNGARPPAQAQSRSRDSRDPKAEMALPGHLGHPGRRRARAICAFMDIGAEARASLEDELFGKRVLFTDKDKKAGPDRGDSRRLPLPRSGRGRLPPDERPQGRVLFAHVPLDRTEDPRPCLLLRARLGRGPPDGARGRPRTGST